jgi:hypothetical protein
MGRVLTLLRKKVPRSLALSQSEQIREAPHVVLPRGERELTGKAWLQCQDASVAKPGQGAGCLVVGKTISVLRM